MRKSTLAILTVAALVTGCGKEEVFTVRQDVPGLPEVPHAYKGQVFPSHQGWTPSQLDGITDEAATLGRVLFYDTRLSVSNTISCGSCHLQGHAFADRERFSAGFRGVHTKRNSQPVFNLRLGGIASTGLFWDTRAEFLSEQVLMPVFDHVEMGMSDIGQVIHRVSGADYYPALFERAYGSPEVTEEGIRTALHDFLTSMISMESKYDRAMNLGPEQVLTGAERLGLEIYEGKGRCSSCHGIRDLVPWGIANIGLDMDYADNGVGGWMNEPRYSGLFKIPSLRNIAITAPYMHDGRFATLDEVIEHYNSGVRPHINLDFRLRAHNAWDDSQFFDSPPLNPMTSGMEPVRLNLTEMEKSALKAFLHTLTDYTLLNDPKFSDPFIH